MYVNDFNLVLAPLDDKSSADPSTKRAPRQPDIQLRFSLEGVDPLFQVHAGVERPPEILVTAYTSLFGADLAAIPLSNTQPVRFGRGEGVRVNRERVNPSGCLPYDNIFDNDALLVHRGDCTFLEKLARAKSAGASGVVVINDEEMAINPSSDAQEIAAAGDMSDVAIVVLKRSAGQLVATILDFAEAHEVARVMLMVDPEGQSAITDGRQVSDELTEKQRRERVDSSRVLYINGHAVLNTRLMV